MTALPTRHWWLDATAQTTDGEPPPAAALHVRCHRRLRGPFTAAHFLLHQTVPNWSSGTPSWWRQPGRWRWSRSHPN
ncbi:hypothetical protein [Streptomyces sp. KL116D]|uniref:hypothetical protein n=1 Tax=Streptomyces sp. KL116D TaxID=3045152 RepID=UPI003556F022